MKMTSPCSTPSSVLVVKLRRLEGDVLAHHGLEAGLVDGDASSAEGLDLLFVVIDAHDVVADFGKASACEADVSRTDDGEFH